MPERGVRRVTWQVGRPTMVADLTLWSIDQLVTHAEVGRAVHWCALHKEPVAIVVRDGARLRAIGPDGASLSLDLLREQVPGLDAVLASP